VLPITEGFPFHRQRVNDPCSYELYLPDDETFFRHLALEFFQYSADDLRASISRPAYVHLAISDKGQNLRGVISMLDDLSTAYRLFTNKYWRTVLSEAKEDAAKPLTFERGKLESFLPNDLVPHFTNSKTNPPLLRRPEACRCMSTCKVWPNTRRDSR
jgi:hypothetical protein